MIVAQLASISAVMAGPVPAIHGLLQCLLLGSSERRRIFARDDLAAPDPKRALSGLQSIGGGATDKGRSSDGLGSSDWLCNLLIFKSRESIQRMGCIHH